MNTQNTPPNPEAEKQNPESVSRPQSVIWSLPSQQPSPQKKEWIQQFLQKSLKQFQTDENKKWFQVFVLDPILTHVLERIFPFIVIFTVLFVLLTVMITLTLALVFLRLPASLRLNA